MATYIRNPMNSELLESSSEPEESQSSLEHEVEPNLAKSQHPESKHWGVVALSGILLMVSGLAVGVPRWTAARGNTSDRPSPNLTILPVKTTQIKEVKSYTVTRTYTGEVVATRTSELGFERSGKIISLRVDRGDRVAAGTAIAKLDTQNQEAQRLQLQAQKAQAEAVLQELRNGPRSEAIAAARAEVRDLQDRLALEKIKRDRRDYLYREGAISREQLDEVAYNWDALKDRLAAAQSKLQELENGTRFEQIAAQQAVVRQLEASIADMEITIAKSTMKAPFYGTIGERRLDEGVVVSAGQPVVRLVEGTSLEVEVGVPADIAPQLKPGSQQRVNIGQINYRARVVAIKPEVNSTTRTRTVVLALDGANIQSIAPEQIARLEVTQTVPTNGYWLPTTALTRGERGLWSCYALVKPEKRSDSTPSQLDQVERRDVEVLYTEGDRVLVRGMLQPSDTVILDGVQRIVPGQLVRRINS